MYSSKKSKSKPKKKNVREFNSNDKTKKITKASSSNVTKYTPSSIVRKPIIFIRTSTTTSPAGLTSKERSYIISSCQKHNSRYTKLKTLAQDAMKDDKVYVVYGGNTAIRKALNERGWVEKVPPQSMNLVKLQRPGATKDDINKELERLLLSNLVEKHPPNFIWKLRDFGKQSSDLNSINQTIVNKLKMDTVWSSKQGLCSSLKDSTWFVIEDVSETYSPRTYNSFEKEDADEFAADFKLTACTSLLKWILQVTESEKVLFVSSGKVSVNIIAFALNRVKEFILKQQNKDIDCSRRHVSESMWKVFLKNYYRLIDGRELFEEDSEKKGPLFIAYANILIRESERYRPQLKCEGVRNVWIVKPSHMCRGRGIRFASQLEEINKMLKSSQRRVVQKYIEDPLLIHETKFDIRQYYLVTSTFPLVIWMYKDCYLKFSSQKYDLKNYHPSIHLTNHAVQRKYKNCQGRHAELPCSNMWSLERFKEFLKAEKNEKVWNEVIYPGMKKCIIGVMLSSQDYMSMCKNRFELFGCDFILDKEYRPWLIEINSCPDLNPTTKVTAKICAAVVEDIVKVVIDRQRMIRASTGKFECMYRQNISFPVYHRVAELAVQGSSLPSAYFCKSSIVHEPLDSSVEVDRECDILATFRQLKALYGEEKESHASLEISLEVSASEQELEQVADTITSQLDVLLEKVPSDATVVSNHPSQELDSAKSYFSEMDLTVLHKPVTIQMSSSVVDLHGKYGYDVEEVAGLNLAEKIVRSMSKRITTEAHAHFITNKYNMIRQAQVPPCALHGNLDFPTAPSKILNFITRNHETYNQPFAKNL